MDEGVRPNLIQALYFITDGAQRPWRQGRRATVAHGDAMASGGGSPNKGLERATIHQILHGLFLRDHSETVIPFCLPSSGGGRRLSGLTKTMSSFPSSSSSLY
jgi:hypothetical protein